MAVCFPDVQGQSYQRQRVFSSLRSPVDSAADQSASFTGAQPLWMYTLAWNPIDTAAASAMLHAFDRMGGDVGGLDFFEWPALQYSNVYLTNGDGASRSWDLPCKSVVTSGVVLRISGVAAAITVAAGAGANGRDRITLGGAVTTPVAGDVLRVDFFGRRLRNVRLGDGRSFRLDTILRMTPIRWSAAAVFLETSSVDLR